MRRSTWMVAMLALGLLACQQPASKEQPQTAPAAVEPGPGQATPAPEAVKPAAEAVKPVTEAPAAETPQEAAPEAAPKPESAPADQSSMPNKVLKRQSELAHDKVKSAKEVRDNRTQEVAAAPRAPEGMAAEASTTTQRSVETGKAPEGFVEPVLEKVEISTTEYPKFEGVRIALLHTANTGGELEPCG